MSDETPEGATGAEEPAEEPVETKTAEDQEEAAAPPAEAPAEAPVAAEPPADAPAAPEQPAGEAQPTEPAAATSTDAAESAQNPAEGEAPADGSAETPAEGGGTEGATGEVKDVEDGVEEDLNEEGEDGPDWREELGKQRDVINFWKATTGHRPESAEIARRIEGFDDDFKYVEHEEEEDEEEEEEEEEEDVGPDYRELIQEQLQIKQEHKQINHILQQKVLLIFEKQHKQTIVEEDPKNANKLDAGYEVRFTSSTKKWQELLEEEERVRQHYQAIIFDHKTRLEERYQKSQEIRQAFRGFKMEVARSAENSKTGRPIAESRIQEMDGLDAEREEEVEKLRLRYISLRAEMRKLETKIRQKEQLAEGLHLIDFEQLKIENQSLNEKIEERNEELLKLRKKTTATVQVLTHIKEKLQFVEKENQILAQRLMSMEKELVEKRDRLQYVKTERDKLRNETTRMKENTSYVGKPALLQDVSVQKDKKEELLQKLAEVKAIHSATTEKVSATTQKILQMTEYLNTPGSGMYLNTPGSGMYKGL